MLLLVVRKILSDILYLQGIHSRSCVNKYLIENILYKLTTKSLKLITSNPKSGDVSFGIHNIQQGGSPIDRVTVLHTKEYVGIGTLKPLEFIGPNCFISARAKKVG